MPFCNGMDRGLNFPPPETGQTSDWSLIVCSTVKQSNVAESWLRWFIPTLTRPLREHKITPVRGGGRLLFAQGFLTKSTEEGSKLSTLIKVPALSGRAENWHQINWRQIHRQVRGLQIRIAKATEQKHWRRVNALQRMLTRSFAAKALAVRRVTENRGKKTAGVDR